MNTGCIQYFIMYFTRLFVIISPLAIVALFVSMTGNSTMNGRIRTAKVGSLVAYVTMLFFAIAGQEIFIFLGITMGAFYIAGGIIIMLIGLSMLRAEDPEESVSQDEINEVVETRVKGPDIAITPFGIPIICGPSCITALITLQDQAHGFFQNIVGLAALTAVAAALYLLLIFSARGTKWLTPAVLRLSYRLSGLILAALAVQMIITGIKHDDVGLLKPSGECASQQTQQQQK
ncbi:MAG: MarC family protein [Puniceicoccales bacterium]|jgi:multiple antibiotic resistance protein|nr:MarC family protein [Puniceicoccales bacterium]